MTFKELAEQFLKDNPEGIWVHFNDDPEENKTVYYVSLHLMGEAGEVDIPMGRRAYRRMSEDMRGRYPYLII